MGTQVDHVRVLSDTMLRIRGDVLERLRKEYRDRLPEVNLLDEIVEAIDLEPIDPDREYKIVYLSWIGEGSVSSWDLLLDHVLPETLGKADLVFHWGDGTLHGVRVDDGIVTVHEVEISLGKVRT